MEQFDDTFIIGRLISGYLKDDLTQEEQQQLQEWVSKKPENNEQFIRLIQKTKLKKDYELYEHIDKKAAWEKIKNRLNITPTAHKIKFSMRLRLAAAAVVLVFLSVGGYFLLGKKVNNQQQIVQNQIHDIAPGGNKAILTLADGKKISLTDAKNGTLANQDVVNINKTQDGQLVYNISNHQNSNTQNSIAYNTIETPRGGQYHLTLADGTQVWLNAASSLRYPTTFTGKERIVELTGEAYFEVVHNAKSPFKVISNGQEVEDIGTHFNINAYTDEPSTKTTLLEGAVRVSENNHSKILNPGQQASFKDNQVKVQDVDVENIIAWKNGQFNFNEEQLGNIMRQVARWYNLDISFQNNRLKEKTFSGITTRFANVSELLHVLEKTGEVKFKIDNKKITVFEN